MALSTQPSAYGPEESVRPGPAVPVLVVTTDDELWVRLSAALPGLRLEQYDSIADLTGTWQPSRPAAVLLDARAGDDLARALESLQTHSVSLVPVVLVDDASRPRALELERTNVSFGHVEWVLEPEPTLAALERAGEEAQARALLVPPGVTDAVTSRPPPPRAIAHRNASPWLMAVAATLLIGAGAAAWWYSRSESAAVSPAPAPSVTTQDVNVPVAPGTPAAAPAPDASGERIETLLAAARAAMRDRRYIDPDDDNALAHYRGVLEIDPANGEARQGLDRVAEVLVGRADASMAQREYPAALRALEAARSLKPDHPQLAALDAQVGRRLAELSLTQIQAALQANAFDRATTLMRQAERSGAVPAATLVQLRQEMARREARNSVNELVRLVQARLAQGRVLEPANDSAKYHLAQLQQRPESGEAVARLRPAYNRRVIAEARAAIARGEWSAVEPWLAELRATGAPSSQLDALQGDLARAKQRVAAAEAARLAEAQQAAAVRESVVAAAASGTTPAPPAPVVTSPPRPLRALQPQYPKRALEQGLAGWVDVEFLVDVEGRPQNVRTFGAEPSGVFEQAAVAAIRRARFEPGRTADGTPMATSSRMRVRFTLQD